jgi:formylglycine-generating enzyme required for sulfatase activity
MRRRQSFYIARGAAPARPLVASLAITCLTLWIPGRASAAAGDEVYTQPGRLVASDRTRLNLYCMGSGSPTVVFDSGWEDWAPVWAIVQPRVAQLTAACSYDRAGAGFSDAGPMPRTSVRIADELHSALHNAGVKGPYILVGHAFGGDNVRTFAVRYMGEVAGMVLVEADVGGLDQHRSDDPLIASLKECRQAIEEGKPLPRLPTQSGTPTRSCAQQFFRGLPEQMWSPQLNAKLLELAQTKTAMYDTFISEMEQMSTDEGYLEQHPRSFGSRPIRVLSTGYHGIHAIDPTRPKTAEQQKYEDEVAQAQARWLALSSNAKQLFTANSSEYIPFDQPDFVVDAIHQVYAESSGARPVPAPNPRTLDRRAADGVLLKASYYAAAQPAQHMGASSATAAMNRPPGSVFRDCPACPEMVVIPAGSFTMGSSPAEKHWAATHGGSAEAVADEAPQHLVRLRSFALSRYPVTRGEYAAFVRETGHPVGDGCGKDSFKWNKDADLSWRHPGFDQGDRDPVVCVSWNDAKAFADWLNSKLTGQSAVPGPGNMRYARGPWTTSGGEKTRARHQRMPGSRQTPRGIRIRSD